MRLNVSELAAAADKVEHVIETFAKPAFDDGEDRRLEFWRQSLNQIHALLADKGKVQIAMVGTTGAGKSTLLNAILEHEILPTGVMEPCTAFVTTVSSHAEPEWNLEISYLSRQNWEVELELLGDALHSGTEDESRDERSESNKLKRMAKAKLAAVFGLKKEEIHDDFDPLQHSVPSEVEEVLNLPGARSLTFASFKDLHSYLRKLVHGESFVWPLIEQVRTSGPIEQLPYGIELVDLPGLNDPNRVRVETTRNFLSSAPHVWVVFNMKRGLTEDIHSILSERGLLRRLILGGTYSTMALVGTHADDVDADNAESLGLSPEADFLEVYAEYRRLARVKVRKQISDFVSDLRQPDDNEETFQRLLQIAQSIPVIPTSSRAYIQLKGITRSRKDYGIHDPTESGVPEVQQHLARVASDSAPVARLAEVRDRMQSLCDELEFFFRSLGSASPFVQREKARAELVRVIETFEDNIKAAQDSAQSQYKGYRKAFLDTLKSLEAQAQQGVQRSMKYWNGIHPMTLKAIMKRNGCFVSPTSGQEYDFNDDISSPLLNLLPVKWEHFFTDQIDRVVESATNKLEYSSEALAANIETVLRLAREDKEAIGKDQLRWFRSKMDFLRDKCREVLAREIRDRRGKLTSDVYNTAQAHMQKVYGETKSISGVGMKVRILEKVTAHATRISAPLQHSIEDDLTEGLGEVWLQVEINLKRLFEEVRNKAEQIGANATIDLQPDPNAIDFTQAVSQLDQLKEYLAG